MRLKDDAWIAAQRFDDPALTATFGARARKPAHRIAEKALDEPGTITHRRIEPPRLLWLTDLLRRLILE